jgi:hypothetical protein
MKPLLWNYKPKRWAKNVKFGAMQNFSSWLEADLRGSTLERPLNPRKPTFAGQW